MITMISAPKLLCTVVVHETRYMQDGRTFSHATKKESAGKPGTPPVRLVIRIFVQGPSPIMRNLLSTWCFDRSALHVPHNLVIMIFKFKPSLLAPPIFTDWPIL